MSSVPPHIKNGRRFAWHSDTHDRPPIPNVDPDLAAERRRQILDAISARYAPANPRPSRPSRIVPVTPFGAAHAPSQPHLFASADDEEEDLIALPDSARPDVVPTANDEALALALQQEELGSDEEEADPDLARALALSRAERESASQTPADADGPLGEKEEASRRPSMAETEDWDDSDDSMEEVSLVPSGRSTPAVFEPSTEEEMEDDDEFEEVETPPIPIAPEPASVPPVQRPGNTASKSGSLPIAVSDTVKAPPAPVKRPSNGFGDSAITIPLGDDAIETGPDKDEVMEVSSTGIAGTTVPTALPPVQESVVQPAKNAPQARQTKEVIEIKDEDEEDEIKVMPAPAARKDAMEPGMPGVAGFDLTKDGQAAKVETSTSSKIVAPAPAPVQRSRPPVPPSRSSSLLNRPNIPSPLSRSPSISLARDGNASAGPSRSVSASVPPARLERDAPSPPSPVLPLSLVEHEPERMIDQALASGMKSRTPSISILNREDDRDSDEDHDGSDEDFGDDSRSIEWSRSPSSVGRSRSRHASGSAGPQRPPLQANQSVDSVGSAEADFDEGEDVDMNANDMVEEQDDYARFLANIKNRDLNEVRGEIDDEIRILNGQNKVAMRDSDEITLAMIAQIQVSFASKIILNPGSYCKLRADSTQTLLRHFGIPYITAPMEAEAQCAKLAELGLVDGIITDDSDVFLFGGIQCFKNIFNDSKYAECFLSSDLVRELSLSRERLISLAYLLGSDYTIGLPGVGPVVALELLANFPGPTGIEDFKAWWTKVQRGQDGAETDTKWKQSFVSCFAFTGIEDAMSRR